MTRRRPVGQILDAGTRVWVRLTGRRVDLRDEGWLSGPTGDLARVDDAWLADEVARRSGRFRDDDGHAGLLPSMALLDGPGFAGRSCARRSATSTSTRHAGGCRS